MKFLKMYGELCITCFKESIELESISKLCNCFSITIAQMLMECCQIQIIDDDDKKEESLMICMKCLKLLHISFEFKLNCQKAQQLLNKTKEEQNNQQLIKNEHHIIKEIDHYLDDDCIYNDKSMLIEVKIELGVNKETKELDEIIDEKRNELENTKKDDNRKFKCLKCAKSFVWKKTLNKHYKLAHENQRCTKRNKNSINCKVCDETFTNKHTFKRHYLIQHLNEKPDIQCAICKKYFTQKGNLNRHIKTCHQNQKLFKCDICNKTFTTKFAQSHHKQTVCKISENSEEQVVVGIQREVKVCSLCNIKVFSHDFDKHLNKHNDPLFQKLSCALCQIQFVSQNDLEHHEKLKHKEKKKKNHLCWTCGKCFRYYSNYFEHLLIHTNTRNYKCHYCDKTFIQSTHLKAHVRKHTGEKPFKCDLCEKRFSLKMNRDSHRRTHTGEKPYKCTLCTDTFYDSVKLNVHKRKKHHR